MTKNNKFKRQVKSFIRNQRIKRRLIKTGTVAYDSSIRCHLIGCGCSVSSFIWGSDKLNAIYFEVPKTGSTNIKNNVILNERYKFRMLYASKEQVLSLFPDYYKFAFFRDPISKFVSNYSMFCRSKNSFRNNQIERLFGKIDYSRLSISEFLHLALFYRNHHWEQSSKFLPSVSELNMIGKTCNLSQDWKKIKSDLDISDSLELDRCTNSTGSEKFYKHLTASDIDIIKEEFASDFYLMRVLDAHS